MLKVQKKMIDYQRYVRSYVGKAKEAKIPEIAEVAEKKVLVL